MTKASEIIKNSEHFRFAPRRRPEPVSDTPIALLEPIEQPKETEDETSLATPD